MDARRWQRSYRVNAKCTALVLAVSAAALIPAGAETIVANPAVVSTLMSPPVVGSRHFDVAQVPPAVIHSGPPLFFGFLEFDLDSSAPGGVGGFSPRPSGAGTPR
jgi:hypothetical protein